MALVVNARFFQRIDNRCADLGYRVGHFNAYAIERFDFIRSRSLATGDNRTSMAHAFSRRRLTTGNKGRYRFFRHVFLYPLSGIFFSGAADFTNHQHRFGFGVILKEFQCINEIRPFDRVTANTDSRRYATSAGKRLHKLRCRSVKLGPHDLSSGCCPE